MLLSFGVGGYTPPPSCAGGASGGGAHTATTLAFSARVSVCGVSPEEKDGNKAPPLDFLSQPSHPVSAYAYVRTQHARRRSAFHRSRCSLRERHDSRDKYGFSFWSVLCLEDGTEVGRAAVVRCVLWHGRIKKIGLVKVRINLQLYPVHSSVPSRRLLGALGKTALICSLFLNDFATGS